MITYRSEQKTEYREHMRDGAGTVELTALSGQLPANARLFTEIRLHPGMSIGYHVHKGETEMFYFVSGKGRVKDDDREFDIQAGDCMATPSGHGHAVACTGDEDLVFVAVIVLD